MNPRFYNPVSSENDAILENFTSYKDALLQEYLVNLCGDHILNNIRLNDISFIEKQLENKSINEISRAGLSKSRETLLAEQKTYLEKQSDLRTRYGENAYKKSLEKKELIAKGLLIEAQLTTLLDALKNLELNIMQNSDKFGTRKLFFWSQNIGELCKKIICTIKDYRSQLAYSGRNERRFRSVSER